jgi:hypothetical protein
VETVLMDGVKYEKGIKILNNQRTAIPLISFVCFDDVDRKF